MRVLVAGAAGMLAKDLIPRLLKCGHEVSCPVESDLDITDREMIARAVSRLNPELLINCAAYNFVDRAESESSRADAINGYGVRNLCQACADKGIPLVHFSTDYVFDGTKATPYGIDDEPNPINSYGRSKLLGEEFVLGLLSKFYLVRTSWLFGLHGRNFVEVILDKALEQNPLSVIDGAKGCPTWTADLSDAVVDLIETERYGLYHIVNSEPTTWWDFAAEILRLADIDVQLDRITSEKLGRAAKRPSNSILAPHPLPQVLGREMPSWRDALRQYLVLRKDSGRGTG
jgi:dTDP-4-dehydrorhamnose reductase